MTTNILENDTKFFVNIQNFLNLQEVSKCVKKIFGSSIWSNLAIITISYISC